VSLPGTPPTDPAGGRAFREGKARDRALILPIIGLILLVPPVATLFRLELRIAGIPLVAYYLFAVWTLLIVAAAWLAPRLHDAGMQGPETPVPPPETDGEPGPGRPMA